MARVRSMHFSLGSEQLADYRYADNRTTRHSRYDEPEDNTWEPAGHLDCEDLLCEFQARAGQTPPPPDRPPRPAAKRIRKSASVGAGAKGDESPKQAQPVKKTKRKVIPKTTYDEAEDDEVNSRVTSPVVQAAPVRNLKKKGKRGDTYREGRKAEP